MTSTLITGIGELVTCDPSVDDGSALGILTDAAVAFDEGIITWVGPARGAPETDARVDVAGRCVVPGFVDSHTHLVFAGDRAAEFAARMAGEPYTGGGIATTVAATRSASSSELRQHTARLMAEMTSLGTTTVEIKSGYGLNVAEEQRLLRIAEAFTEETTYLGAHAIPPEYTDDRAGYVDLVAGAMLEACAPHAKWVDVFCDVGAFDEAETRRILGAGIAAGLRPRLHGNQLGHGPGVRLAVEYDAASVDHCTFLADEDVDALRNSATVATLLPGADFSTRSPYPDARRLLDAGVTVALATDCNPGSAYITSMPLCMALAVREMQMSPAEALLAATGGGAAALRRDDIGRIAPGLSADLLVLDAPSYFHLVYRVAAPKLGTIWKRGIQMHGRMGMET